MTHPYRKNRVLDVNDFIRFLEERGGGIYGSKAGQVPSKLANVLGVPPNNVSQFLKRMERRGIAVVDRGEGGRFIYGVRLVTQPKPNANIVFNQEAFGKANYVMPANPEQLFVSQPNTSINLSSSSQPDYSALASLLLEKATDAIAENERLRERVAYLEEKLQVAPQVNMDDKRRNVIQELMKQVGSDA